MPEHDIEITLPSKPLANVDMTLVIKSDGKKLGELPRLEGQRGLEAVEKEDRQDDQLGAVRSADGRSLSTARAMSNPRVPRRTGMVGLRCRRRRWGGRR